MPNAATLDNPPAKLILALTDSLRSTTCPSCLDTKPQRASLCRRCYKSLRPAIRVRLYLRIGEGYEHAMADALESLGAVVVGDPPDIGQLIDALNGG